MINIIFADITILEAAEWFLRIIAACIFGFLIGLERTRRFKDAGVRTYTLVACASALLMIVSKYSAYDMIDTIGGVPDTGRIAAQVVSGISFLGAGVIFKHGTFMTPFFYWSKVKRNHNSSFTKIKGEFL